MYPIIEEKLRFHCDFTSSQVLLRYLVQRGIIVIPKSTNPKRLEENIQIFDFTLSDEDMEVMKAMNKNRRYFTFQSYKGMPDHPQFPFKTTC
ncbi:aldo-keto reductase family 1 member D1 [Trichonephila clavipes]|nr:aldo-keto reductase family 1 member D1 [Trichonephila clavipes]